MLDANVIARRQLFSSLNRQVTQPCNGFGGIVNGWPDSIAITDMVSTLMLCADEDLNAADSWFPAAVQRVTALSRDGDQLIMWGDGFELIFDPAA